jgi:RimJ/RimL family protein N-acetyltransferase
LPVIELRSPRWADTKTVWRLQDFGVGEAMVEGGFSPGAVSMVENMFRLVMCDDAGQPMEALGALSDPLKDSCQQTAQLFRRIGYRPPWVGYVAFAGSTGVGGGAFIGAPRERRVEIAYFTLPEHERNGYATATARSLLSIAREADPTVTVIAKTLPEENASTHILRRHGFQFAGDTHDDDVGLAWLWELAPV